MLFQSYLFIFQFIMFLMGSGVSEGKNLGYEYLGLNTNLQIEASALRNANFYHQVAEVSFSCSVPLPYSHTPVHPFPVLTWKQLHSDHE